MAFGPPLLRQRLTPLVRCLGGMLLVSSCVANAREYRFSPSALEGNMLTQQDIDLSLFSKSSAQLPGVSASRVMIDDVRLDDADITYLGTPGGELTPQLTPDMLRKWGVAVDKYPELAALNAAKPLPEPLSAYIPQALATLDFSVMTLRLSIPQAAI